MLKAKYLWLGIQIHSIVMFALEKNTKIGVVWQYAILNNPLTRVFYYAKTHC